MIRSPSARRRDALTWLLLGAGLVLRVAQYLANRSLWLDEAYLAPTILRRPWSELFTPPDYGQVGPVGFLVLERVAATLFGQSEYALRLVPLLAGVASLFLFRRIAARILPPTAVPLAMALFAFNDPLIYFSSELKPYSLDVAIALGLLSLALDVGQGASGNRRLLVRLALAGAAAVWFSLPAVFVLAGAGSTLALSAWRRQDRQRVSAIGLAGLLWAASFAALYAESLSRIARASWVLDFWSQAFLPLPPRSLADIYWLPRALGALFEDPGGLVFRGLGIFCFLVGCLALMAADRLRLGLLLAPLLFALLASGLRIYPFHGRVLLFLAPSILLLIALGAERLRELTAERMRAVYGILVLLLLFHPVLFSAKALARPRTREEIKPVLARVERSRRPGDRVYVYSAAAPAFDYYAPRYGFSSGDTLAGTWAGDPDGARRDLEMLRGGGRTWVIVSHPVRPDGSNDEERFLPLLDGSGRRLEEFRAPGAAVYLYDMEERPAGGARP